MITNTLFIVSIWCIAYTIGHIVGHRRAKAACGRAGERIHDEL